LFSAEGNPFFGKSHSDETKKILSEKAYKRNIEKGKTIPKWGAEKGRLKCINPIVCYNNKGEFIGEYESITNAELSLGLQERSISSCLHRNNWYKGMYLFKYKEEGYPKNIEVKVINLQSIKRPVYFFLGNTIIEYESAQIASEELNVPKTSINRAALSNFGKPLRSGHIFIYKDLYDAKMAS